jgi:hypothetical protein
MSSKKNKKVQSSAEQIAKNNGSVGTSKLTPKKGSKLTAVLFIKSYTPYVKGDIAGFEEDVANELVEKTVAELV